MKKLTSLDSAIQFSHDTLKAHPERDICSARKAALEGENRKYPVLGINHLGCKDDFFEPQDELELPEVEIENPEEKSLAVELVSKLEPLKMLNPVNLAFNLGGGTGTLVTCFGIPLDPECDNTPAYNISMDEVLSKPIPDVTATGLMPEIYSRIQLIKKHTPETLKIAMPDTQGPFNIAHATVGEDALMTPYTDPDKFRKFMDLITTFWIDAVKTLRSWIGEERLLRKEVNIAECSVNLMSREMYEEFILPCDLRIADAFGPPGIHTCSGPHVFYGTLENIPNIVYTEAGYISMTAAGYTEIDDAMKEVVGKPILLNIGQELHNDNHFETIKNHLDLYERHNRMLFCYTAMNLRKKDRPAIRELHQQLDEYWNQKYNC